MEEEETKFKTADADQDGKLGLGEFAAIINPYHFDHMARLEVEHVRKQYDVDGDGQISRDEYLSFGLEGRQDRDSQEFKDQQQALSEQFDAFDADKSGTLDLSEIKEWVAPGALSTSLSLSLSLSPALFSRSPLTRSSCDPECVYQLSGASCAYLYDE